MPRVAKENAVGAPNRRPDVGITVEHGEAITVLEGATRAGGGAGRRNVEGGFRNLLDHRRGRVLSKQWMAKDYVSVYRSLTESSKSVDVAKQVPRLRLESGQDLENGQDLGNGKEAIILRPSIA